MAEYHVENFGCRASQADGAAIAAGLDQLGLAAADALNAADVLILNTCSVTAEADRETRAFVRKARRANPDVRIVVTGCYAQRAPDELAVLAGVDRVVGNSHKIFVPAVAAFLAGVEQPEEMGGRADLVPVSELFRRTVPLADDSFAHAEMAFLTPSAVGRQRTRPNLKVQDGCGNRCSFCVIPQTRGGSRSVSLETVLGGVTSFVQGGGKELVLSGINLGRWGRDLPEKLKLEGLVESIFAKTALPRLRISSVEPMDWTDALLDLFDAYSQGAYPRLARHAHLPLQSGSDAILRAMFRRYRPWHYAAKVKQIRQRMPDAAIGADVMVGFPGETDVLFEETYRFIEEQPFTYLHLFPFSARPGTAAWKLHEEKPVHGEAVKERMARLRSLIDDRNREFRERFIGRELSVVTLQNAASRCADSEETRSISDNFISVEIVGRFAANELVQVRIDQATPSGLAGRCCI